MNRCCTVLLIFILCFSLSIFAQTGASALAPSYFDTRSPFRNFHRHSHIYSNNKVKVHILPQKAFRHRVLFVAMDNTRIHTTTTDRALDKKDSHRLDQPRHPQPQTQQAHEQTRNWQQMWESTKRAAMKGGLFGAAAGTIQVLSLMWMRTIINYQYRYGVGFQAAVEALYREGGILRFYRGMTYAIIQNPLSKFGAIAANEGALMIISQLTGLDNASPLLASLLGTILSAGWRLLLMPLETCKTILQVDGAQGMSNLWNHLVHGNFGVLYEGSAVTMLATITSHYPWFFVYNYLDEMISKPQNTKGVIVRSAIIGFLSSVVSDTVSNCLRVIKTVKQAMAAGGHISSEKMSYWDVVNHVYSESGWQGLVGRGLATRIVANGIQSVVFTIIWKLLPLYFARKEERARTKRKEEGEEGMLDPEKNENPRN